MAKGGARAGAGRKKKAEELGTAILARSVLVKKYGDLETALIALLESGEPNLVKFVYEHAFGKAPDKVQQDSKTTIVIKRAAGNYLRRAS